MVYSNPFHYSIVMVVQIQVQASYCYITSACNGFTGTLRMLKYRYLVLVL
jgi:hypothetical protein